MNFSIHFAALTSASKWGGFSLRCLQNTTKTEFASSSSAISTSSSSQNHYNCSEYDCVTTEYLNQEMLAAGKYGELLDTRDLQVYRTIKIGDQVWMAQNLNYKTNASVCQDLDEENCHTYGRLYQWYDAMNIDKEYNDEIATSVIKPVHRGICPENWHIPTNSELEQLIDFGSSYSGSTNTALAFRSTEIENGTDDFGFSAIFSGNYHRDVFGEGTFEMWAATEDVYGIQYHWSNYYTTGYQMDDVFTSYADNPDIYVAIRCIQD